MEAKMARKINENRYVFLNDFLEDFELAGWVAGRRQG